MNPSTITPDLTVYIPNGVEVPAAHLNIRESQRVLRDWHNFGVTAPETTAGQWAIMIVTPLRTTVLTIPRSTTPAPAMAVAA